MRSQRFETLAALARLERTAGRPAAALSWEQELRHEGRRLGLEARVEILLRERPTPSRGPSPRARPTEMDRTGEARGSLLAAGGHLSNRVLGALSRAGAVADGPLDREVVPSAFTQAGIADELGIPRGSLVRSLLRLVDRGAVEQVRRRTDRGTRSVKVYLLTQKGSEMARGLPP